MRRMTFHIVHSFRFLAIGCLFILSCKTEPVKPPSQPPRNDLERYGLHGNVRTVVETSLQPQQYSTNGLPTFLKKYRVEFNRQGNIVKYLTYSTPDELFDIRTYTYNDRQKLVEIKTIYTDTMQNSRSVMEYDSAGNMVSNTVWRRNSFLKHLFEYDTASNPIKHIQIDPPDTTIVLITNDYDTDGRIIRKDQKDMDKSGIADVLYEYTYDAKGNIINEHKKTAVLGDFDFVYQYGNNGKVTHLTTFDSITGTTETTYNKFGKEVKVKTYKSPDDATIIEYDYEYDKKDNYIYRKTYYTKRDENGRMVKMFYSNELREVYYY